MERSLLTHLFALLLLAPKKRTAALAPPFQAELSRATWLMGSPVSSPNPRFLIRPTLLHTLFHNFLDNFPIK
jgi:hypothetical protein